MNRPNRMEFLGWLCTISPKVKKCKRYELRTNLVSLGYQQLQKSVWLGYAPLPEEFMRLIKNYGLGDKVQIVSIDKKEQLLFSLIKQC